MRDDIERFIARTLPSGSQKKARKYIYEYAQWRGQLLKYSTLDKEIAKEISRNLYQSSECFYQKMNNDAKSREIINQVFSEFHNTFPRSYRYIYNNAKLGGWTTREIVDISCP